MAANPPRDLAENRANEPKGGWSEGEIRANELTDGRFGLKIATNEPKPDFDWPLQPRQSTESTRPERPI